MTRSFAAGDTFTIIRTVYRVVEITSAGYIVTVMPADLAFGRQYWAPETLAALGVAS